jgi:glutamine---fructose-6-phosphate transaminase (isomerizing)
MSTSQMYVELMSAPSRVAEQLTGNRFLLEALGNAIGLYDPRAVVTVARGSSDHASSYFAYLTMARAGKLVTSLPMSLFTIENPTLDAQGVLAIAFSQSGRSPDLLEPTDYFRRRGAMTIALVNDAQSPLALAAQHCLPLHAGVESSVAATKSFIGQMVAGVSLLAAWRNDKALAQAITSLPQALEKATALDWSNAIPSFGKAKKVLVIGRGPSLAVAQEAALKLKEVCGIAAQAFSGAEVRHGPMSIIDRETAVLVFAPAGPFEAGLVRFAQDMRERSAAIWLVASSQTKPDLPMQEAAHLDLAPICIIQTFYRFVEALSRALQRDPDRPPHLNKVTLTL